MTTGKGIPIKLAAGDWIKLASVLVSVVLAGIGFAAWLSVMHTDVQYMKKDISQIREDVSALRTDCNKPMRAMGPYAPATASK